LIPIKHLVTPHSGRKVCNQEPLTDEEDYVVNISGNHPLAELLITKDVTCPECRKVIEEFMNHIGAKLTWVK
jgi:hypothetical protein